MQPIFPPEVTSSVPRITLTGREMLHVEQHRGLLTYDPQQIELRTACGTLRITGDGLRFTRYTAQEALLTGAITGVSLLTEGGGR